MDWIKVIQLLPAVLGPLAGIIETVGKMFPLGSDAQKREEAARKIAEEAKTKGFQLPGHLVNLLVELGVVIQKYNLEVKIIDNKVIQLKPRGN